MCSYYRRFCPNFSEIAEPLIALTRKHARFKWTDERDKSFQKLKDSLKSIPILGYPDVDKGYIVYTDASDTCIGAVLCQEFEPDQRLYPNVHNEKPIHYLSHRLSSTQQRWSTLEKEAFAIKYALEKFHPYIRNASTIL
jgi:hypothetical protein